MHLHGLTEHSRAARRAAACTARHRGLLAAHRRRRHLRLELRQLRRQLGAHR
jgi:hypothetical protein